MIGIDALMGCCGVYGAYGFNEPVQRISDGGRNAWGVPKGKPYFASPTEKDLLESLQRAKREADNNGCSCCIIFLADGQEIAMGLAEKEGFKRIHSFYNPNSGNNVYIYTFTLYDTEEEYREAFPDDDEDWDEE